MGVNGGDLRGGRFFQEEVSIYFYIATFKKGRIVARYCAT